MYPFSSIPWRRFAGCISGELSELSFNRVMPEARPPRWQEILDGVNTMRAGKDAPVDTMGCEKVASLLPPKKQDEGRGPQWVFLGCPGVGKGTYASRLSKLLDVSHIAMGDLVRNELKGSSPLSKQLSDLMKAGKLLPDEIIFSILSTRLEQGLAAGEKGFILDGFPRTISQAEVLEDVTEIDLVVNLKLREDVLISKCLGRRICSQCGGNFNLAKIDVKGEDGAPNIFMPPLLPPPACASKMTIRADDTDEVVRARLRVYHEESAPVEDFYRSRGKLLDFNVGGGIPETWPNLLAALNLTEKANERGAQRKLVAC